MADRQFLTAYLDKFSRTPALVYWRAVEATILSSFEFREPILDLGCGDGFFASLLLNDYEDVFGVDISDKEIEKAKAKDIYKECKKADVSKHIPYNDSKFNTVLSNYTAERLTDLNGVLKEIKRVLTNEGVFLFTVPSLQFGKFLLGHQFLRRFNQRMAERYSFKRNKSCKNVNLLTPGQQERILKECGFKTIKICSYMNKKDILFLDFWHNRIVGTFLRVIPNVFSRSVVRSLLQKAYNRYPKAVSPNNGGAMLIVATKGNKFPRLTRLNAGCGNAINPFYRNQDVAPLKGVDVVHDLNNFPWPFEDNSFKEIKLINVLEHLQDTTRVMEELYRISENNGIVRIRVPYWNSYITYSDPTHIKGFHQTSFDFFDPTSERGRRRQYYTKAKFKIIRKDYYVFERYKISTAILKNTFESISKHFCNVIYLIDLELKALKSNVPTD